MQRKTGPDAAAHSPWFLFFHVFLMCLSISKTLQVRRSFLPWVFNVFLSMRVTSLSVLTLTSFYFCCAILILSRPSFIQSWSFLYLSQHLSFTLNYQETKMDGSFHFAYTKIRGLKTALTAAMDSLFKEAARDRSSGSLNGLDRKWADEELKGQRDDGMGKTTMGLV